MFHDFCQSVTLVFCQRTHVSHDHHPRGPCCSRARISYDEPYMGAISYQKIFASALRHPSDGSRGDRWNSPQPAGTRPEGRTVTLWGWAWVSYDWRGTGSCTRERG